MAYASKVVFAEGILTLDFDKTQMDVVDTLYHICTIHPFALFSK